MGEEFNKVVDKMLDDQPSENDDKDSNMSVVILSLFVYGFAISLFISLFCLVNHFYDIGLYALGLCYLLLPLIFVNIYLMR